MVELYHGTIVTVDGDVVLDEGGSVELVDGLGSAVSGERVGEIEEISIDVSVSTPMR